MENKTLVKSETKVDTIPIATFNQWKAAWVEKSHSLHDTLRYFDMNKIDLSELLGENPDHARFYLGLDTLVRPWFTHLMLIGVDAHGKEMLDPGKGDNVYDVTRPCPPNCGGGK